MNLDVITASLPKLLQGAALTLDLVALSLLAGAAIALPLALMRVSERWWLRVPAYAYIFVFRGTPLLVQIFLVYYGLGRFEGVRASALWPILREPYWCAIIAFALNTGAYTAEILRGAIQAVPVGEVEAAKAFGMSRALSLRRIILPRALRIALPAYGNEVILMLKGSALASTITLLDLTGMARTIIARTYMPVEIFLAAGLIYLAITFVFVQLFRLLERRLSRHVAAAR
jgi:polar amino acid transport system permease protein